MWLLLHFLTDEMSKYGEKEQVYNFFKIFTTFVMKFVCGLSSKRALKQKRTRLKKLSSFLDYNPFFKDTSATSTAAILRFSHVNQANSNSKKIK